MYYYPLDFDARAIGLGPAAHAEFSVDGNSSVWSLVIVEKPGAAFVFKLDEDSFGNATLRSPRTEYVGVLWMTREKVD